MEKLEESNPAKLYDPLQPDHFVLLNKGMELAQDIPNGHGGWLYRKGEKISPGVADRLKELAVKGFVSRILAQPVGIKTLTQAAAQMEKAFDVIEKILIHEDLLAMTAIEILRNHEEFRNFQSTVRRNMEMVFHNFTPMAVQRLNELQQHHPGSGNHSIITGLNEMVLAKSMGLSEVETINRVMAIVQHDIGKTRVSLKTLNWPEALNPKQWQEMQLHALFGFQLLYDPNDISLAACTALLHHEWYASVPGKGYGGLTLFREALLRQYGLDMAQKLRDMGPEAVETVQQASIVDMVAALEEIRSYKKRIGPFKVLIIMVSDARMGHFNPRIFATWYQQYRRDNPRLLSRGFNVALPREIERKGFTKAREIKLLKPLAVLTLPELDSLGLTRDILGSFQVDKARRQGGLSLREVRLVWEKAGIQENLDAALQRCRIDLHKNSLQVEDQMIVLESVRHWITIEQLERADLIPTLMSQRFSLDVIRAEGGMTLEKLTSRGSLRLIAARVQKFGLDQGKPHPVLLPAYEHRLSPTQLDKLGLTGILADKEVKIPAYGIRVDRLATHHVFPHATLLQQVGLPPAKHTLFTPELLTHLGYDTEIKIFYDILVVEEIDGVVRAKVAFTREGDAWQEMRSAPPGNLDTLQAYLLNNIGVVEMNFSKVIELPDLGHVRMGAHWPDLESE
ncbi:MAG: hypothetical protein H7833_20175 [Magnetococcus sp. DMHC-1]|nr:hypothetical protein [Magnetococcales bacterium]